MNPTRAARIHRMRALAHLIHTAQLELADLRAAEHRIITARRNITATLPTDEDDDGSHLHESGRIRRWARANGYQVADTGTIPHLIRDEYNLAHERTTHPHPTNRQQEDRSA